MTRALAAALLLSTAACGGRRHTYPLDIDAQDIAERDLASLLRRVSERKIPPVEFAFDSAELLSSSYAFLDRLVEIMRRYPYLKLTVSGHTDDVGGDEYNRELSRARAGAVKTYLATMGVYPDYVRVRGFGKSRPLVQDASEQARALNRRVEFSFSARDWEAVY